MTVASTNTADTILCSVCHLKLEPEYYFCPNCGTKIITLSTDAWSQLKLYAFSIILPYIAFIAISHWYGLRYVRSTDVKRRVIGWVAVSLLVLSTVSGIWYTVVAVQNATKEASKALNGILGE